MKPPCTCCGCKVAKHSPAVNTPVAGWGRQPGSADNTISYDTTQEVVFLYIA